MHPVQLKHLSAPWLHSESHKQMKESSIDHSSHKKDPSEKKKKKLNIGIYLLNRCSTMCRDAQMLHIHTTIEYM